MVEAAQTGIEKSQEVFNEYVAPVAQAGSYFLVYHSHNIELNHGHQLSIVIMYTEQVLK